jgi:hypothetical protein
LPRANGEQRVGAPELFQGGKQVQCSPRHQGAQGDGAGELISECIDRDLCATRGVYHFPGVLKEDLAGRGKRDLALGTVE